MQGLTGLSCVKTGYAYLGHLFQILNKEIGSLQSQLKEAGILEGTQSCRLICAVSQTMTYNVSYTEHIHRTLQMMTSKTEETLNNLKDQSHVLVIAQIEYNQYLAPVLQWNIFWVLEYNFFPYILKSWNKMWFKICISERWILKICWNSCILMSRKFHTTFTFQAYLKFSNWKQRKKCTRRINDPWKSLRVCKHSMWN